CPVSSPKNLQEASVHCWSQAIAALVVLHGLFLPSRQLSSHSQAVTAPQLRVKNVPDGIAKKVERKNNEGDGEARENYQGPMGDKDVRDGPSHHIAPGGRRRGNTHPEEA